VISELRIKQLRADLAHAVANIAEIPSVAASHTLRDAPEESSAVGGSQTDTASHELTVLPVVIESSERTGDSVEVREIAVTI